MRIDGPKFIGNALCLDFINTLTWRGTPWPHDYLRSYGDIAREIGEPKAARAPSETIKGEAE